MLTRHEIKAYTLLSIAILELAFMPIVLDIGGTRLSTLSYMFYTFLVGSMASFAMIVGMHRLRSAKQTFANRRLLFTLAVAGVANYAVAGIFLTFGTIHTSASLAGVLFRSWVLLTVLFIPYVLKVKVNKYQIVSLLIAFLALYIAMTGGTMITINLAYLPYIIILLLSAVAAAVSNVMLKATTSDLPTQVFIFNLFSLVLVLPLLVATGGLNSNINMPALVAILFAGIISYSLGSFFYFYALKSLDVTTVGNATLIIPFLTFFFASIILKEQVYSYYILLAFIVVAGMVIQRMAPRRSPQFIPRKGKINMRMQVFDVTNAFVNNKGQEISNYLTGSNKALAVIDEDNIYTNIIYANGGFRSLARRYNCIFFTNKGPHPEVKKEEIDFMDRILGAKGKTVLVGIGNTTRLENLFSKIYVLYSNTKHNKLKKVRKSSHKRAL